MGLDMYLEMKLPLYGESTKQQREAIKKIFPTGKAAYWRKANAIHQWFVDNIQEGAETMRNLVPLTKASIDAVFEKSEHQARATEEIYRLVLPEMFDPACVKVKGWPSVNHETSKYLLGKFIEFDRKHHPSVMAGGLWLNNGFSTTDVISAWQADISACEIVYQEIDEADPQKERKAA